MVTVSFTKTELWDAIFFLFYLNLKAKATFLILSHTLNYILITDLYRQKINLFFHFKIFFLKMHFLKLSQALITIP